MPDSGLVNSSVRDDPIFHAEKILQGGRQANGQFLPGQHLASRAKICGSYATHNVVPGLDQVGAAAVQQRAEIELSACAARMLRMS